MGMCKDCKHCISQYSGYSGITYYNCKAFPTPKSNISGDFSYDYCKLHNLYGECKKFEKKKSLLQRIDEWLGNCTDTGGL